MLPTVLSINATNASGVINERMTNANRMNRVGLKHGLTAGSGSPPSCLRINMLAVMLTTSAPDFFRRALTFQTVRDNVIQLNQLGPKEL
jgi:hypothetical protein